MKMNLPTPEELKEKLSIEQQEDEFSLRKCYEEWLERSLIPNLKPEGCEGSWQSPTLYKNWETVNSWLGEKGWTIKTWTTREELGHLRYQVEQKPASEVPIPTVDEIADHIDLWFRTGEDKPWSFIVEDLAGSIHSLLTARLKGADHE